MQGGRILWRALLGHLSQSTRACLTWDPHTELVNCMSVLAMGSFIEWWLALLWLLMLNQSVIFIAKQCPQHKDTCKSCESFQAPRTFGVFWRHGATPSTHGREPRKSLFWQLFSEV